MPSLQDNRWLINRERYAGDRNSQTAQNAAFELQVPNGALQASID
jgi:hypothetical protein